MIKINKKVWIRTLLKIRDALIEDYTDEAYDLLYGLADFSRVEFDPWEKWENFIQKEDE